MASKTDFNLEDNYLPPVTPRRTGPQSPLLVSWGWLWRALICVGLLVVILSAQQGVIPGSKGVRAVVNYAFTTNYDVTPWLQKFSGLVFQGDSLFPVQTRIPWVNPTTSANQPENQPSIAPTQSSFRFIYPVASGRIVGKFNPQGTGGDPAYFSGGITIETDPEQPVRAGYPGRVVSITGDQKFGYTVQLDHGQGVISLTAGCAEVTVKPGDQLTAGQVIGQMSSNVQGKPQLYFEVRVQGRPVDPLGFILAD